MKLTIKVVPNERGGYTAVCPCLPGCVSTGQTRQEAKQRLSDAVVGYMAAVGNAPEQQQQELVEV
jgi:predicted RNase H-like HicB family nuclease